MPEGYRGYKRVIIVDSKFVNPTLYHYCLLDWGGNVEDETVLTPYEAKIKNQEILEKEPRLIRWCPKDGEIKKVFL